jgi:hypothetical protein
MLRRGTHEIQLGMSGTIALGYHAILGHKQDAAIGVGQQRAEWMVTVLTSLLRECNCAAK